MKLPSDLIQWLDLTRLTEGDSAQKVLNFCQQAHTPLGDVAAVCVYSEFVEEVAHYFTDSPIKVASVCNFPEGKNPIMAVTAKIDQAIADGATEIDLVMPYYLLLENQDQQVLDFVNACRQHCQNGVLLKVIIESGELREPSIIERACHIAIKAQADFIKTSTGKTPVGATLEHARTILTCIKDANANIGLKVSGGIRTIEDATQYVALAQEIMGEQWLSAQHFRIGASSLLEHILINSPATI